MKKENEDLYVAIAKVEEKTNNAHKRIDELQVVINAFYDLATEVKVMVNEMTNMKTDIKEIKGKMSNIENEPNRLLFNAKNAIITVIVGGIVGAIMALIIK